MQRFCDLLKLTLLYAKDDEFAHELSLLLGVIIRLLGFNDIEECFQFDGPLVDRFRELTLLLPLLEHRLKDVRDRHVILLPSATWVFLHY